MCVGGNRELVDVRGRKADVLDSNPARHRLPVQIPLALEKKTMMIKSCSTKAVAFISVYLVRSVPVVVRPAPEDGVVLDEVGVPGRQPRNLEESVGVGDLGERLGMKTQG